MRLTIVRHGETDWNGAGRIMGHLDLPLNANGIEQARRVAGRLASKSIDAIVTSDLGRAAETARAIAGVHPGASWVTDPRFRERNAGVLQGRTRDQNQQDYPEIIAAIDADPWNAMIPGGESRAEMSRRVKDGLFDLRRRYLGKSVVLVTHGGVIQRIVEMLNDMGCRIDPKNRFVNTCIIVLDWSKETPAVEVSCDASHLAAGPSALADNGHFQI